MKQENENLLIIWGIHPIEEAVKASTNQVKKIFILPSFGKKKSQQSLLKKISDLKCSTAKTKDFHKFNLPTGAVHQGICALISRHWETTIDDIIKRAKKNLAPIILCDQLTDPQNLGAIIRTAVAFDAAGIIIPHKNNARINGTVVKASAGAVFHTKICTTTSILKALNKLKEENIPIYGLDVHSKEMIFSVRFTLPMALILGSESRGIRKSLKKLIDHLVKIPINKKIDSLNVSCSACIALYEISHLISKK